MQLLQAAAGNRAVGRLLTGAGPRQGSGAPVQRVRIDTAGSPEVLLWDQNKPGTGTAANGNTETATSQFQPREFMGGGGHYDMTRQGNDVTVEVHIVFTDSANAGKAIPSGDERIGWATNMCQTLVHVWNGDSGRFQLVGQHLQADGTPAPAPTDGSRDPNEVDLNLRFVATPVFDVAADAKYPRVAVHPSAQVANGNLTGGTAITAGDWFMSKNNQNYAASPESIYAHEYGHLLGIPDEYSQNNPQMHAIFHQISPSNETRMNDELDRAAIDQLVMLALRPKLMATVNTVAAQVAAAIGAQHPTMDSSIAAALRRSWRDPATVDAIGGTLRAQLVAAGHTQAAAAVPTAAHFEAFDNLSNVTLAKSAVAEEIDPARMQTVVQAAFTDATQLGNTATIHYPGGPGGADTSVTARIDLSSGAQTNAATGPLATAAGTAATGTTAAPPGDTGGHRPPANIEVPNTIIAQLLDLPNQWKAMPQLMDVETADMAGQIQQAVAALAFPVDDIGDSVPAMYRVLYDTVQTVSDTVATASVRSFLSNEIDPVVASQVQLILHAVEDAVQGVAGPPAPGSALDPGVQAAATQMAAQVKTLMAQVPAGSPAGTGTGSAATQTAQDVKYTMQSQMGDNVASDAVRPDQTAGLVAAFNSGGNDHDQLRHPDEGPFAMRNH